MKMIEVETYYRFSIISINIDATGTTKSTIADQTTVTELTLESQVVDSTYTCKVSGHEEYSFTASVEINGLYRRSWRILDFP